MGEAEALARALDDPARLGRVLGTMVLVLRITGDHDGAIAVGRQVLELAAALGDSALQGQASYYLGRAYDSIGDSRLSSRAVAAGRGGCGPGVWHTRYRPCGACLGRGWRGP